MPINSSTPRQRAVDYGYRFGRDFLSGQILYLISAARKEMKNADKNPSKYYSPSIFKRGVMMKLIDDIEKVIKENQE